MPQIFKKVILVVLLMPLLACSTGEKKTQVLGYHAETLDSSSSRLIIYREPVQEVEDHSPYLYINNVDHGALASNSYQVIPVDAGSYYITIKQIDSLTNLYGEDKWPVRPKSTTVSIQPGQEKFIRYTVRINKSVFDWYDANFEEVTRDKALVDLDFMARQR